MRFAGQPLDTTARGQLRLAIRRMIVARDYRTGDKLPTYRDLAEQFGVALLTVHRVMQDLAEEGTVYRVHAKGAFVKRIPTAAGRMSQVGLIYPASRSHLVETPYLNQMLGGIVRACDEQHADLQILSVTSAGERIQPHEAASRADGVLLVGVVNREYVAEFTREGIPLVLVDAGFDGMPVPAVCTDNARAVNQVMDHLYALGHRRIAYLDMRALDQVGVLRVGVPVDSSDTRERREAYLAAMARLGLSDHRQVLGALHGGLLGSVRRALAALKGGAARPTAVLAYDVAVAAALVARLQTAGLDVPRDLSVAGAVGAQNEGPVGNRVLTYASISFRKMGFHACRLLFSQASGAVVRQGGSSGSTRAWSSGRPRPCRSCR